MDFIAEGRLENHVDHSYHIVFRAGNWRWLGWQNGHKKAPFFQPCMGCERRRKRVKILCCVVRWGLQGLGVEMADA